MASHTVRLAPGRSEREVGPIDPIPLKGKAKMRLGSSASWSAFAIGKAVTRASAAAATATGLNDASVFNRGFSWHSRKRARRRDLPRFCTDHKDKSKSREKSDMAHVFLRLSEGSM